MAFLASADKGVAFYFLVVIDDDESHRIQKGDWSQGYLSSSEEKKGEAAARADDGKSEDHGRCGRDIG